MNYEYRNDIFQSCTSGQPCVDQIKNVVTETYSVVWSKNW